MKTSTIIATLAVTLGFASLTAANMKLKSEYDKGHLVDPYVKQSLPAFKYIKDLTDSSSLKNGRFEIHVGNKEESSVGNYYAARNSFLFNVKNDTLYITLDKSDGSPYSHWFPIIFRTKQLESLDVVNGEYVIISDVDSDLSIKATRKSEVEVRAGSIKTLSVLAANTASISVSAKDTIAKMNVRLDDKSTFNAKDLVIGERSLQLSKRSNIELSGRSIENFGVKNN